MPRNTTEDTGDAIRAVLISPNECDTNLEPANVVDALFFVGRCLKSSSETIAKALLEVAMAIREAP